MTGKYNDQLKAIKQLWNRLGKARTDLLDIGKKEHSSKAHKSNEPDPRKEGPPPPAAKHSRTPAEDVPSKKR